MSSRSGSKSKKPSQMVRLVCTNCKNHTHYTMKNVKKIKEPLELQKYCPNGDCRAHFLHKEEK